MQAKGYQAFLQFNLTENEMNSGPKTMLSLWPFFVVAIFAYFFLFIFNRNYEGILSYGV